MSALITILNGPNLNLLGKRQPELYGSATIDDVAENCAKLGEELGVRTEARQSNFEGELVEMIHKARETSAAIVINPAAYSHTSIEQTDNPVDQIDVFLRVKPMATFLPDRLQQAIAALPGAESNRIDTREVGDRSNRVQAFPLVQF